MSNDGSPFLDKGYDADSGALQIGSIDFQYLGGEASLIIDSASVVGYGQSFDATFYDFILWLCVLNQQQHHY